MLLICGSRVLASLVDDTSISRVLEKPMMLTEVECFLTTFGEECWTVLSTGGTM